MTRCLAICLLTFVCCLGNSAYSDINYNEAVSGDLGTPQNPTALGAAGLGVNTVTGLLNNTSGFDPDAFSFVINPGLQLDSLVFTSMSGTGLHFFAFNNAPLSTSNGAGNLISTLISANDVGVNILNGTLNSFGGSGLSGGPLGPGTYRVWFQETAGTNHNYTIQFTTSVPEPTGCGLLLAIACGVCVRRK